MKIVMPGGSGNVGRALIPPLARQGHEIVVLSRSGAAVPGARSVAWDGVRQGPWARELDGADVVVNLAGRSVDCRYHKHNLTAMLASRIDSTRAVGRAIEAAHRPPPVWLQASTATIYAHTYGPPHDEDGELGGHEEGVPDYWRYSIEIAEAWERELYAAATPDTRRVALRMAMVMSPVPGSTFGVLHRIASLGLGGPIAGGGQFMSWIHDRDLVRAVELLIERDDVEGHVNLAAPNPLPHAEFMAAVRSAVGMPLGVPAPAWLFELATLVHRTDSELILKSRRVVSRRLAELGFEFEFEHWADAARDLVQRRRTRDAA